MKKYKIKLIIGFIATTLFYLGVCSTWQPQNQEVEDFIVYSDNFTNEIVKVIGDPNVDLEKARQARKNLEVERPNFIEKLKKIRAIKSTQVSSEVKSKLHNSIRENKVKIEEAVFENREVMIIDMKLWEEIKSIRKDYRQMLNE